MKSGQSRAFLFGLTLTELMILFVFLLALLIGAAEKKTRELETMATAITEMERELNISSYVSDEPLSRMHTDQRIHMDLEARLQNLQTEVARVNSMSGSISKLLVGLKKQDKESFENFIVKTENTLASQVPADKLIRGLHDALDQPGTNTDLRKQLESLRNASNEQIEYLEHALSERSAALTRAEELAQRTSKITTTLKKDGETQRRRVEHYRKKLATGRGVDLPPCWLNEAGSAEYLFTVSMTASGYQFEPAWAEYREYEAHKLPSVAELSGSFVPSNDFLGTTQPLFTWANERECRHFVRVMDNVGDDKKRYKRQLQRLEQHFYKYLVS